MFEPINAAVILALKASKACKSDSDCVGASDVTCVTGGCGASVAKVNKTAFDATIAEITDTACPACKEGGCDMTYGRAVPSCAPLGTRCEKGRCAP